jgi:tRNA (guanosine-2'-O-)-methyltransferase
MRESITDRRKERIRRVLEKRQKDLTLVVDNVWDPHNVSAILRSCDAFGVGQVHLYYTTASFPELGKKSSASALKWVARQRHTDAGEMATHLRGQGMNILATGFTERAKPLSEWDLTKPTAIILSNEHSGIKPELENIADGEVYIPMMGMIPSFNVSVAAALILYESFRQRMLRGMFDEPTLAPHELESTFEEWCSK